MRKNSHKFNCNAMFVVCKGRAGGKDLHIHHLNSQSMTFETSLPSLKDIITEHKWQLQSRDLTRHAILPYLAYAKSLLSAFLLTLQHSGLCYVFCRVTQAPPFFFCEKSLSSVIVIIATVTYESSLTLEASFLYLFIPENHHTVSRIVNIVDASEPELRGPRENQNTCHLLLSTLPFQAPLEK